VAVAAFQTCSRAPAKVRVFMPYLGGMGAYRPKCNEIAANRYEGFALSG
jgi:cyclohexanone monooxygenase